MYDVAILNEREYSHSKMLRERASANQTSVKIVAPMPGLIKGISIKQGSTVRKGDQLYILEAMKMENIIKAPITGTITTLSINSEIAVEKGSLLCIIEPQVG
ncbi:MAG: biotin/lipoyl-binding protein [Candidatus Kapabacteria bacterium]|nr:biotin/lipoyl-binding protein [Candidatus Kapabacteria bacterium]